MLKINVRLDLFRCHHDGANVTLYLNARLHLFTVFVQNKCSFIYFSNIFLNKVLKIHVREGLFSAIS